MFLGILKKQLILKNVITEDDWESWKYDLMIDYAQDNHFSELKDQEILRERLQSLDQVVQYVGEYFSKEWVMKNILKYSEDDIKDIEGQIDQEPEPEPRDNN